MGCTMYQQPGLYLVLRSRITRSSHLKARRSPSLLIKSLFVWKRHTNYGPLYQPGDTVKPPVPCTNSPKGRKNPESKNQEPRGAQASHFSSFVNLRPRIDQRSLMFFVDRTRIHLPRVHMFWHGTYVLTRFHWRLTSTTLIAVRRTRAAAVMRSAHSNQTPNSWSKRQLPDSFS
jgi:hypothetical protein